MRLKAPWALRGFTNDPLCVVDPAGRQKNPIRPMPQGLYSLLLRCDGACSLEDSRELRALKSAGLIEEGDRPVEAERRYRRLPYPRKHAVLWSLTGRCNYRCRHCFMAGEKDFKAAEREFNREKCLSLLDEMAACGVMNLELTGGEPLLFPYLEDLLQGAAQRGMRVTRLLTNGALLTAESLRAFTGRGFKPEVAVSFDGLGTHDWMRARDGAEVAAVRAMGLVREAGLALCCAVNVNAVTAPRLLETCRFLRELGASSLYIIRTCETPRWAENEWAEQAEDFDDFFEGVTAVVRAALEERWGIGVDVFSCFSLTAGGNLVFAAEKEDCGASCAFSCPNGQDRFFLSCDGRVLPCDAFEGICAAGGLLQEGNSVYERRLWDILTDSPYSGLFALTQEDVREANEACRDCERFPQCHGGCRAYGYGASMVFGEGYKAGEGELLLRSPFQCAMFKGGHYDRLRRLADEAQAEYGHA